MAERTGDLSVSPTTIYDPATGNQTTGAGRIAFPGNKIDPTRINPISAKILNIIPLPNLPDLTNNYLTMKVGG